MINKSLSEWEQRNLDVLTSKEMGVWLGRRENRLLDEIKVEIDKARFIDKDTRICKNALASGLEVALSIIDKYKSESKEKI